MKCVFRKHLGTAQLTQSTLFHTYTPPTSSVSLFLAGCLSQRHARNDLLIANIITLLCLHVVDCEHMCISVHIGARAHVTLSICTCVGMCSRIHITHRSFKYSFYPDVLLVHVSAHMCTCGIEIIGHLSPEVQL